MIAKPAAGGPPWSVDAAQTSVNCPARPCGRTIMDEYPPATTTREGRTYGLSRLRREEAWIRRGGEPAPARAAPHARYLGHHRPQTHQPLRRRGDLRRAVRAVHTHRLQRAPERRCLPRPARPLRPARVRRRVPPRPVRPARCLRERVRAAHLPGRAPRGALRQALRHRRRRDRRRPRGRQALRDQPGRVARGLPRGARDAPRCLPRARGRRGPGRLPRPHGRRARGLHRRARPGHGPRRHPVLPEVLLRRGPRADHHGDPHDRHLLVRPLPPHHLRHPARPGEDRRRGRLGGLQPLPRDARGARPRRAPRLPHGHGHHRRQVARARGQAREPRQVRGDQRLHGEGQGGRRRHRRGLALPLQERDPQPPDRNRALRRRGHLHRRRHP